MIKAIETVYSGYRFRSRLEARWAVFFDTLGVRWEYEKEGFDLGKAGWYLPDFFIPAWDAYVEIKPMNRDASIHNASEYEAYIKATIECAVKCQALFDGTQSIILLIQGEPWIDRHLITLYHPHFSDAPPDDQWHFAGCRKCDKEIWLGNVDYGATILNNDPSCRTEKWPIEDHPLLIKAYNAARQARFEHGEKPQPLNTRKEVASKPKKTLKKRKTRQVPQIDHKIQEVFQQLVRGDRVRHPMYGDGVIEIESRSGSPIWINFDDGLHTGWFTGYAKLQKIEHGESGGR